MALPTPTHLAPGWLGRPHYEPVMPAHTPVPRITWHTDPHRAGWDRIVEDRDHMLCWSEVNGIFRYAAWVKDPNNRPGHGGYWSSRASVFGPRLGLNLTEILVGNGAGYAARIEDIAIPNHLRWCAVERGDEKVWHLVPAGCPSWQFFPPCSDCQHYERSHYVPRCRLGEVNPA